MNDVYDLDRALDYLNDTNIIEEEYNQYLLEYAGNPEYNDAIRELMKDMDDMFKEYSKDVYDCVDALNKISSIVITESKKKNPDTKKAAKVAIDEYNKMDKKLSSKSFQEYRNKYNITFTNLKKICRKFSIKYSDVILVDKKEFDKKLEAAWKKIANDSKVNDWMPSQEHKISKNIDAYNEAIEILFTNNADNARMIGEKMGAIYNLLYSTVIFYLGNIQYLRRKLRLNKENGLIYKAVNSIIKTKPQDKK